MRRSIEATFYVTTPMFMAGSDQQRAEFRISSLLGALRFWYRATAPQYLQKNITALREAEATLFGGTGSNNIGQAQFLVRLGSNNIPIDDNNEPGWCRKPGIAYLGYGPITYDKEKKSNIARTRIKEYSIITLKFTFRPQLEESEYFKNIKELQRAIIALSLFGGLGSRSRRGFGSVTLISLKEGKELWSPPRTRKELYNAIREFTSSIGVSDIPGLPAYTAFTSSSRVILSEINRDPINLLDGIGREMIRYRSYGKNKNGEHILPWNEKQEHPVFADDHDLLLSLNKNSKPRKHPRRVAFGLPHNYYFGSTKQKIDVTGEISERRASPLFIHIHELEKEYVSVLTYLPAQFLPANEKIKIRVKGQKDVPVPCNFDDSVITDFLARIPQAVEVKI